MSFISKLRIDGEEYNVLEFNISFKKEKDTVCGCEGGTKGGVMILIIETIINTHLLSWMLDEGAKNGKIIFYRRDSMTQMKELTFVEAFCVGYDEQFISATDIPMKITMELVAKELTFGDERSYLCFQSKENETDVSKEKYRNQMMSTNMERISFAEINHANILDEMKKSKTFLDKKMQGI